MLVEHYAFNERGDLNTVRKFQTVKQIKEFLRFKYDGGYHFGCDELMRGGQFKEMAINYDFRPWLQKFLVEERYGGMRAMWAPSKGALRVAAHLSRNDKVLKYPTA
jgi:hypothetical protein